MSKHKKLSFSGLLKNQRSAKRQNIFQGEEINEDSKWLKHRSEEQNSESQNLLT